jgi:hypothetical protein
MPAPAPARFTDGTQHCYDIYCVQHQHHVFLHFTNSTQHTVCLCCVLCACLRAVQLVSEGFYEFWNWFDSDSWYPLGRVVGGTVYPGIMLTAGAVYTVLTKLTAWVQLRDVCVLTGPFFAGNTVRAGCGSMAGVWSGGVGWEVVHECSFGTACVCRWGAQDG